MENQQANAVSQVDKLKSVFISALRIPSGVDVVNLEYRGIPQWDSMAHVGLIADLENAFEVMLKTDEVLALSSFAKAKEILRSHGIEFES